MKATWVDYLALMRWKNLLLAGFIQLFLRYGFSLPFGMIPALDHWQFASGVLATVLLMAAGYIINDLHDIESDKVNKPQRMIIGIKITEQSARGLYYVFTAVALIISLYLCLVINKLRYFSIPSITAILLYLYAVDFKRRPMTGNVIIALLAALSILTVLFFDVLPVLYTNEVSAEVMYFVVVVHIVVALFAFLSTLVRELFKTLEDTDGDRKAGYMTLPIAIGEGRTLHITYGLMFVLMVICIYSAIQIGSWWLYAYVAVFLLLPWGAVIYVVQSGKTNRFYKAQNWMKVSMLTGILSLLIIQL